MSWVVICGFSYYNNALFQSDKSDKPTIYNKKSRPSGQPSKGVRPPRQIYRQSDRRAGFIIAYLREMGKDGSGCMLAFRKV